VWATQPLGDVLIASARAGSLPWNGIRSAVEETWRALYAGRGDGTTFEAFWETARRDGGVFDPPPIADVRLEPAVLEAPPVSAPRAVQDVPLLASPHIFFEDGRGADKPWLQEVPEPLSQLVWDTWVAIHPETAARLGVARDGILEITSPHGVLE